jgi:plasmid replication initiation protein
MAKRAKEDENNYVVKSNTLVEARYRLSLQESHVVLWLLTQIKPDDEDFKSHRLDVVEYANLVGLNAKGQYQEMEQITKRLMKRVLEVRSKDVKRKRLLQVSWLSSAEYFHGEGYVLLCFDPKLKPYLLQLKGQFTKINISDAMGFKSVHALRIFELLVQYEAVGNRKTSIEEIRQWCGVEKDEYELYADLKRKVINRAKDEINLKTDYEIDYEEIKDSRKVVAIDWSIQKKTKQKMQIEKAVIIEKEMRSTSIILEQLLEYGFAKSAVNRLIKKHELDDITNAIKAVEIYRAKNDVKNAKALVETAIKEKWQPEIYQTKTKKKKS